MEILARMLERGQIKIVFSGPELNAASVVEMECCRALQKIKAILEDSSLDDRECFMKIEAIVCLLEELGSDGGRRHNFGAGA